MKSALLVAVFVLLAHPLATAQEVRGVISREVHSDQAPGPKITEAELVTITKQPQRVRIDSLQPTAGISVLSVETLPDDANCAANAIEGSNCRQVHRLRLSSSRICPASGDLLARLSLFCAPGGKCLQSTGTQSLSLRLTGKPTCVDSGTAGRP